MSGKNKKNKRVKVLSSDDFRGRIMNYLFVSGRKPLSLKELMAKCRCRDNKTNVKYFNEAMNLLLESGDIVERKRGFVRSDIMGYFTAKVSRLNRTFGFIEKCSDNEEIFVPGKFLAGAMPGDMVLAAYISSRTDKPEGEVIDIIRTANANVSGIIIENDGCEYFLPDTMSKQPLRIIPGDAVYRTGDKVLAKLVFRGKRHSDHKVRILISFGSAMRASCCSEAIVAEKGVMPKFPDNVAEEARKVARLEISDSDLKGRLDLRDKDIFTIDSAESKDLDDAVSLERTGKGWILGVHIADVSHYVKGNSALDKEAMERGTSVYYADKVIPMLPVEISNGICSLNPGEDRLTFSAIMELSSDGGLMNFKFAKSVIHSRVKGIYSEVNSILEGTAGDDIKEKYSGLEDTINLMSTLADILISNRKKRGSPEIETSESALKIENDICVDVKPRKRAKSERIIEEFMLTANEAAAQYARELEVPFVYRVHEPPTEKKIANLKECLLKLNIETPVFTEPKPIHIAEILENAKDSPAYQVVNMMTLRSMTKAWYDPEPKGHFGLALDNYSHFTSPIRRYPDLAIHRILTDMVKGMEKEQLDKRYEAFVHEASRRSSDAEVRAMEIERECEDCYKAEYMQQHLGDVYEGIISGVTEFGFYVELPDTIEGLVHINTLPEGNYIYDGYFSLSDEYSSRTFTVGDSVRVMCAAADVNTGKIDFELSEESTDS